MNDDTRPNPNILLNFISHDRSVSGRGRLKLFFGASAGVGKTYAMLAEANRKLSDGLEVVVGVVETHGREETAALLEGLPCIPRREVMHRGVTLYEFDLEAALERNPSLILIDELAHTNAPGSRHPKRWQDVEELLKAGIDVFTTLNVQHLESMNDMVAKLTGIVVRETVPDSVFESADDIVLIDISSDELLVRLNEGKVYVAEGANRRAAENFFKKTNLIALRELALRRTAEHVDTEHDSLSTLHNQHEVQLGQKILVCVGHDALSEQVIRHAKRMAIRTKAPWYALYIETGRHHRLSDEDRRKVVQNLYIAKHLGAEIIRISGSVAADEIVTYAQRYGFTHIVVGHTPPAGILHYIRGSLATALLKRAHGFEVAVVIDEQKNIRHTQKTSWKVHIAHTNHYLRAFTLLVLITLLMIPFRGIIHATDDFIMMYLTVIVIIAAKCGIGPSIASSFISVAMFNFFFTKPYYTFYFYDLRYYITFAFMLVTSLVVGSLASRLSLQLNQLRNSEKETRNFYSLTRNLSGVRGMHNMIELALKHVRDVFGMDAVIFATKNGQFYATPANSPARELKEESVARWVIANGQIAGRNTDTLPSARGLYAPMNAEGETFGVLGLIPPAEAYEFTSSEISQLETFASLIASAFGRAHRAEEAERAKVESESEKLRNVLLSSFSHDLRTPLASISGISSNILLSNVKLPKHAEDGLRSIHDQSSKLAKIVTNLLDVSSLESGKVSLNRQPYFLEEVIGSALLRLEDVLKNREVNTQLGKEQLIHIDGLLIEQVCINLLENATNYAGDDAKIYIHITDQHDFIQVTLSDNGRGIPHDDIPHIFEKFYKGAEGGLGLGLPICRAIIEVHGGRIWAENNSHGGATFHFTLPKN